MTSAKKSACSKKNSNKVKNLAQSPLENVLLQPEQIIRPRPTVPSTHLSTEEGLQPQLEAKSVGLSSRKGGKQKLYASDQAKCALNYINNGMSTRKASIKWSVPRTTLQDLKKGCYTAGQPGPSPVLTNTEEQVCVSGL
jgi:hypothetical protein